MQIAPASLDVERFTRELRAHTWSDRVAAFVESVPNHGFWL